MSADVKERILIDEWRGLYRESWKGVIVDESFSHPAKFSRALIQRIYEHVIEEGWATKGNSVVDPFGGVALGAFPAMQHGLVWYGCELEEKFVTLGIQNIVLWNERYSRMPNWGAARLLQGDSRSLIEVLSVADCCVSSPPYVSGGHHTDVMGAWNTNGGGQGVTKGEAGYGQTDGQLGGMKEGDHSLVVSSPPYAGSLANAKNYADPEKAKADSEREFMRHRSATYSDLRYGETEGNLGAMPEGTLSISSPPFPQPYTGGGGINVKGYSNKAQRKGSSEKPFDLVGKRTYQGKGGDRSEGNLETLDLEGFQTAISSPPYEGSLDHAPGNKTWDTSGRYCAQIQTSTDGYGAHEDNVGLTRGETFWSASRLILEQLHQVIVPGGHAVFVVKAFVRDKKIVDFPAQWAQLCEAVGFRLLHDHHALLTEHYGTQGGFDGDKKLSVERKSFFRRLAESKGSPRIDHENVLCFERP